MSVGGLRLSTTRVQARAPLRWKRPRLATIHCEKPSSAELARAPELHLLLCPHQASLSCGDLSPSTGPVEHKGGGAQAEKEPRAAGGQAGSERLCSAFFFLPLSLLSSFSAAQAEPGCSELTIIAASRQCLVGGLLLCACRPPRGPKPGPQPLPGTLGGFPHPCPSVDAMPSPPNPQSFCLLFQLGVHLCPSPTLGSTGTPLCSILWPEVQKQDTAQEALGAARGLEPELGTARGRRLLQPGKLPLLG